MKKFLTLKHWQLFCLLIGIPMILEFILMGSIFSNFSNRNPVLDFTGLFVLFPITMILFTALFFSWFYALGTNLSKKLPDTAKMSLTRFKLFLFFPAIYILFLMLFIFGMAQSFVFGEKLNPAFLLIFPIHIFSMFCLFYCLNFNAKALKTVELQKPVTFSDYAGEFFLLWFFPVGVWILQPRINRLFVSTPE